MFTKVIIISLLVSITVENKVCDDSKTVDISRGNHLPDGSVYFNGDRYDKLEYFVDDNGVERGCVCLKRKCISKCCPFGYGYMSKLKQCVKLNESDVFDPPVWDNYRFLEGRKATETFHFLFGKKNCSSSEMRLRVGQATKKYHLRLDGKLYIEIPNSIPPWMLRGPDKYCIDTFVREDPVTGEKTTQLDALICFAEKQDEHHYILSSSCMLISCVFFLATVAVYGWLPELRNLHGKVLMVYLMCLFIAFLFLATMQVMLVIDNISPQICIWFTIIIYFSLESAFFWLNVMSFDIWWTFSGKRGPSSKLSTRARFAAYSAYAFGIPTLLTILLASLEFSGLPPHPLMPMLRHAGCFIYGNSKLIYLYGPIIILCIANMVFFVLTALKIAQIKKQTSMLKSKESSMHDHHRNDKQRLLLYMKLFAVMGINWIMEVVSALYPDIDDLWKFTDAYNVLIGLIIFVIFVCKRKIFRLIKKRIKETFHQPQLDIQELTDLRNRNIRQWQKQEQRIQTTTRGPHVQDTDYDLHADPFKPRRDADGICQEQKIEKIMAFISHANISCLLCLLS